MKHLQVSGQRFWSLLRELTSGGELLRGPWFVHNYCPLAFLLPSGANLTPNRLPLEARQQLQVHRDICPATAVARKLWLCREAAHFVFQGVSWTVPANLGIRLV